MTVASGISCIPDMARAWSVKTPDKAALIDGDRVVTYAELDDLSNRIANTLIAAGTARLARRLSRQELRGVLRDLGRRQQGGLCAGPAELAQRTSRTHRGRARRKGAGDLRRT